MAVARTLSDEFTDSRVNIFYEPVVPIVTTNGVNKQAYTFSISPSEYFNQIFYYPYINKSYPDRSIPFSMLLTALPGYSGFSDSTVTTFSASNLQVCLSPTLADFNASFINNVTYPDLKYVMANLVLPLTGSSTINYPELVFVSGTLTASGVSNLTLPKLEVIGGSYTITSGIQESFSFPELLLIGGSFNASGNRPVTIYSFPKLKVIGSMNLSGSKPITTISFGALEVFSGTLTMPTTSFGLTSFSFANTLKIFNSNFVTTSNALNETSVDNILVTLAALDGTNGTVTYSARTVTITGGAATPSATGLTAKATLQARGCTVTTN